MAITTKTEVIIPELFKEALGNAFGTQGAFMRASTLASSAAVVVDGSFSANDASDIGSTVSVPVWAPLEFIDRNDGEAKTAITWTQTKESATVAAAVLPVEMTRWARAGAAGGDPYQVLADYVAAASARRMDKAIVAAASGTPLVKDVYDAGTPAPLTWDRVVEAKVDLWGDSGGSDIAAMIVHSKTFGDLMKTKSAVSGEPVGLQSGPTGVTYQGVPVVVSDSLTVAGALGSVTEAGTAPPDITISTNTPNRRINLKIVCTVGGARGTAKIRYSFDGGLTYSAEVLTAASIPLLEYRDGWVAGESVGVTLGFESASSNVDNVWTAPVAVHKFETLLVKPASLAFWFNQNALIETASRSQIDVIKDSEIRAAHLYFAAHRYSRVGGVAKPGVIKITHN